jgi:hypothetical protein
MHSDTTPSTASGKALAVSCGLVLLLALACVLWRWAGERDAIAERLERVGSALSRLETLLASAARDEGLRWQDLGRQLEAATHRDAALVDLLDRPREALGGGQVDELGDARSPSVDATAAESTDASLESDPPPENAPADLESLPPLPGGRNPEVVLDLELDEFLKDRDLNPDGRNFDRLEAAQARLHLARAKARAEVLQAEILVGVTEAMARLAERGAFVDYAPGERYENPDGLLTTAEEIAGGGVRMYYLSRDEFASLYAMRAE